MSQNDVVALFDKERASNYDAQATMFSWRPVLDEFTRLIFRPLGAEATILCVGAGTGLELAPMALAHPGWRFLALEPAAEMLALCRQRAEREGFAERCEFFNGYLEDLPPDRLFDGATCLLVSHFMTAPGTREQFFRGIAQHLRPGGLFINCDLAADQSAPSYAALEGIWFRGLKGDGATEEQIAQMAGAYRTFVAVRPPAEVAALLETAGFSAVTPIFQALLLHGWCATRE